MRRALRDTPAPRRRYLGCNKSDDLTATSSLPISLRCPAPLTPLAHVAEAAKSNPFTAIFAKQPRLDS